MNPQDPPALVLAGPTASGKSEAALRLAQEIGGAVICADSMQVYRDLRIVTARPSEADEARAPHRLYGHVDGSERYSAGRFASEAKRETERLRSAGLVPIFCGGTGLYLKALVEGLSPMPGVPDEVVAGEEEAFDADPVAYRDRLVAADPAMEALKPNDRQRHVRAGSVLRATGRPLSMWQDEPRQPILEGAVIAGVLLPPREELYARCEARFSGMLAAGAAEEVERLLERDLDPGLPVMKALGVPELAGAVRGTMPLEDAAAMARQATRRFAKRQMTWFRNQTDWPTFADADALIADLRARFRAAL